MISVKERKRTLVVFLAVAVVVSIFATPVKGSVAWIDDPKDARTIPISIQNPSIWGDVIVFGVQGTLSYYRISQDTTTSLGVEGSHPSIYQNLIAYRDGRDLKLFDLNEMEETDLGVKAIDLYIYGDFIVVSTDEQDVGNDLNVDGDTNDYVIQLYKISTGETINTGADGRLPSFDASTGLVVFKTNEVNVADFNEDGDDADTFIRTYDVVSEAVSTFREGRNAHVQDGYISYYVEDGSGDSILHTFDIDTSIETDLGVEGWLVSHQGDTLAIEVAEWQVGDINEDGDINEHYVMYYSRTESKLYNTWVEGANPKVNGNYVMAEGSLIVFALSEPQADPDPEAAPDPDNASNPQPEQTRPERTRWGRTLYWGIQSWMLWNTPHKVFVVTVVPGEYNAVNMIMFNGNGDLVFEWSFKTRSRSSYIAVYLPDYLFSENYTVDAWSGSGDRLPYIVGSYQGVERVRPAVIRAPIPGERL